MWNKDEMSRKKLLHVNFQLIYSGEIKSIQHGVAFMLTPDIGEKIESVDFGDGRTVSSDLDLLKKIINIMQAYAA